MKVFGKKFFGVLNSPYEIGPRVFYLRAILIKRSRLQTLFTFPYQVLPPLSQVVFTHHEQVSLKFLLHV